MSTAPQLFPKTPLGQSFDLEYGAPMPERDRSGFGYPVFGSNGIVGRHSKFLIAGPGIVVGRKGSVGEVSWSSESFWPIDTAYYVVPKAETNLRWLYWLLNRTDLKRLDAATGVPGLNRNDVYSLQAHRPPPPDQPRIALVLDTVDEAIAKTEAVIAKLRQVRAGLLHDLLTRGLEQNGQLRDPIAHPEQFQPSPLGLIPNEWEAVTIESIGAPKRYAIVDGPFGSNLKTIHYRESGIPVIQSGYLTTGKFRADSYFYVDRDLFEEQKRSAVAAGDIVMAKIGAQCGTCALMPDGHPVGILAGNSLKISTNARICRAAFLVHVLQSYYAVGKMDHIRSETAQPAISLKQLRELAIPRPHVDEQDLILACVASHDRPAHRPGPRAG